MPEYTHDTYIYEAAHWWGSHALVTVSKRGKGENLMRISRWSEQKGFPVALSPIAASSIRKRVYLIARAVISLMAMVLDPGRSAKLRSFSHPCTMSVKSIHLAWRNGSATMVALGDSARNDSSSKHRVVAARLRTFGDKHSIEVGFQSSTKEIKPSLSFQIGFFLITTNTYEAVAMNGMDQRALPKADLRDYAFFFLFKSYSIEHPEGLWEDYYITARCLALSPSFLNRLVIFYLLRTASFQRVLCTQIS